MNTEGKLTIIPRTNLDEVAEFLMKFKTWTKQLEHEKSPTLWMVWPTFIQLKKHLASQEYDSEIIEAMKTIGREYIEKNVSD